MGVTSSSSKQENGEGAHFINILKPPSKATAAPRESAAGGGPASSSAAPSGGSKRVEKVPVTVHASAAVVKNIECVQLWDEFLSGPTNSFALTPAETAAILLKARALDSPDGSHVSKQSVDSYLALVQELSENDKTKALDFMAICSSVLLLSPATIEAKIDLLFMFISLADSASDFGFEEFFVALTSFERGLSHAMGVPACSEAYVRAVATQWFALADPKHRGCADPSTRITSDNFFDFCTNRQTSVRRLIEGLAGSVLPLVSPSEQLQEIALIVTRNEEEADSALMNVKLTAGDEFMANPAWKKTAERMVPPNTPIDLSKPNASLTLDWVHGYRGFDCRNNLNYLSASGSHVSFTAAALSIAQNNGTFDSPSGSRTQTYFGEHGDDIISIAVQTTPSGKVLLATGEVGKKPAIHLYEWVAAQSIFRSLACISGLHTKGVAQLAFSSTGERLFSVSVEYAVAVYDCNPVSPTLGRMVASGTGPKGKIMHSCNAGVVAKTEIFVTCGEKHLCVWSLQDKSLKMDNGELGPYKNKILLSCAKGNVSSYLFY